MSMFSCFLLRNFSPCLFKFIVRHSRQRRVKSNPIQFKPKVLTKLHSCVAVNRGTDDLEGAKSTPDWGKVSTNGAFRLGQTLRTGQRTSHAQANIADCTKCVVDWLTCPEGKYFARASYVYNIKKGVLWSAESAETFI